MASAKTLRVCPKGHRYYKSSDCPVCPVCEAARNNGTSFLSLLPAPARRALEGAGIHTLEKLARHSEAELLQLHGMGPSSLPKLRKALRAEGLDFKKK